MNRGTWHATVHKVARVRDNLAIKQQKTTILQAVAFKKKNSAVTTRLEKVSFHSNPKERQCQRMLKLPHNCIHLTC